MKKVLNIILFGGMIAAPLVLIGLPSDYFDTGKSMCLSVLLLDETCPGCGMTRAVQHLIHLDFKSAASYNKLSFVVLPVLCFLWVKELRRSYLRIR